MTRAKYLVFSLLAACIIFTSCGCGGSSSSNSYVPENADSAWQGAWTAGTGTASARAESTDRALNVQNIAAVFYSCDVENTNGTARMSALVILSGDMYMPLFFRDLQLSTDRVGANSWTADTPHGTLSITLTSDNQAEFSGEVNYLGYECTFNASVSKVQQQEVSFNPETMLNGTWRYNESQAGGYRFSNGTMSSLLPKHITMCFNDTTSTSTVATTAGYIDMPVLAEGYDEADSLRFYFVNTEEPCRLSRAYGDIYAMSNGESGEGIDTLFFMQSAEQMFMLMSWTEADGQICILLPLTKLHDSDESNIAAMLSRKWSAVKGGGLMIPSASQDMRVSLHFESCDLTFTDINISGSRGSAGISAKGTFSSDARTVNLDYNGLTIALEELGINLWRAVTEKGSKIYVSLLSEREALVIADIVYEGAEQCILTAVLAPSE